MLSELNSLCAQDKHISERWAWWRQRIRAFGHRVDESVTCKVANVGLDYKHETAHIKFSTEPSGVEFEAWPSLNDNHWFLTMTIFGTVYTHDVALLSEVAKEINIVSDAVTLVRDSVDASVISEHPEWFQGGGFQSKLQRYINYRRAGIEDDDAAPLPVPEQYNLLIYKARYAESATPEPDDSEDPEVENKPNNATNKILLEVQELVGKAQLSEAYNHAVLGLYGLAVTLDALGIPHTSCDLRFLHDSGLVLRVYNSEVGWKATVHVADSSVWEVKLSFRPRIGDKYTPLDSAIFNQMNEHGSQCLRTAASVARMHRVLQSLEVISPMKPLETAYICETRAVLYRSVLKIFSEVTSTEFSEYPVVVITENDSTECALVFKAATLSITHDGGPWENSKHLVKITDNNTGDCLKLRSDYNNVYVTVFRAALLAYGVCVPDQKTSDSDAYRINPNLWIKP